jgi:hypothetical protein
MEVLPFWFHLVRGKSRIAEDVLATANASMHSVEGIHEDCVESDQKCLQFVSLKKEVRRFYFPNIIEKF